MRPIYKNTLKVGWYEKPLRDVSKRKRGYSWDKEQETLESDNGVVPVIRIPNIRDGLNLNDLLYLRTVPTEALETSGVTRAWILFVASNGNPDRIGNSALITEDKKMVFASFLQGITSSNPSELLPEFFAAWMKVHNVHEAFSKTSQQTTGLANFSWSAVKKLPVRFPSDPNEQKQIISILNAADEAIARTQDELAAARRLKTALMQQFFTKGIPGRHKDFLKTKWFSIPQNWPVKKLEDLAEVTSGFTMGRDLSKHECVAIPYVTVINVQEGFFDLKEVSIVKIKTSELETGTLQPGDVLMTEGGDRDKLGRGAIWNGEIEPCAFQNHIFRIRFHDDTYRPKLFHFLLQSWHAKNYFFAHAKQTNNLCTINSRELKKFPIGIPESDEQNTMLEIFETAENVLHGVEKKLQSQLRLKKSLLQNLLTGKVRVTTGVTS